MCSTFMLNHSKIHPWITELWTGQDRTKNASLWKIYSVTCVSVPLSFCATYLVLLCATYLNAKLFQNLSIKLVARYKILTGTANTIFLNTILIHFLCKLMKQSVLLKFYCNYQNCMLNNNQISLTSNFLLFFNH